MTDLIAQAQFSLDSAMEHASHGWAKLIQLGIAKGNEKIWPPDPDFQEVVSAPYHIAVLIRAAFKMLDALERTHGGIEGQLCPYEDCAHNLALWAAGWYICSHCYRPFIARFVDSDYEDYHCDVLSGELVSMSPDTAFYIARDLGPSWATPEEQR